VSHFHRTLEKNIRSITAEGIQKWEDVSGPTQFPVLSLSLAANPERFKEIDIFGNWILQTRMFFCTDFLELTSSECKSHTVWVYESLKAHKFSDLFCCRRFLWTCYYAMNRFTSLLAILVSCVSFAKSFGEVFHEYCVVGAGPGGRYFSILFNGSYYLLFILY